MKDLDRLYNTYSKDIYYFILSKCCDENTALDIMQNTFLSAITSIDRFNGTCTLKTWLFSIAKHEFQKHLRKNKPVISLDEAVVFSVVENLEDNFIYKSTAKTIRQEISKLDESIKQIMLLRIEHNLSFKEIGNIISQSEIYCRVNFYRVKRKIRETLIERGNI